MGWKDWVYGDLVSAAEFQSLVQDQTVQRYADSAARTSALGSAVAEGMVSYLDDTNAVEVYDGSSWASISSSGSGNAIINGGFDIWQRGTSGTVSANETFAADRWRVNSGGGGVLAWSQQTFTPGQTDVAGNPTYYLRCNYTTSGTGAVLIETHLEDVGTLAGQVATLSFYAKISSGTKSVTPRFIQNFGSGGSTQTVTSLTAVTLTTSWQRFTITATVPSITGKTVGAGSFLRIDIDNGTSGVLAYDIANFQLEAGSSATAFKRNAPSIQGELAACQRYYYRLGSSSTYEVMGNGIAASSTTFTTFVPLKVTMRTAPSSIEYSSAIRIVQYTSSSTITATATSIAFTFNGASNNYVEFDCTTSGLSRGWSGWLDPNGSSTQYLAFSSEL